MKEKMVKPEDFIIYIGGRFGEDAGASFIEISKVNKLLTDSLNYNSEKS
jgi:pyruvate kinase